MRLSSKSSTSHPSCQARKLRLQHSLRLKLKHNLKSRHNPDKKLLLPLLSLPLHRNHSSSSSLSSLQFSKHKPPTSLNNSNHTTLLRHQARAISSTLAMQVVPYPSNQFNSTLHL